MHPLLAERWIAERIDEAVAPWQNVLAPDDLAWMREQLAETLATDEHAARLLSGARPRVVEQSGEVACEPAASDAAPVHRRRSGT